MPPEKAQKLKEILTLLSDSLTRKDFELAFSKVVEYVKADKQMNVEQRNTLTSQVQSLLAQFESRLNASLDELKSSAQSFLDEKTNKLMFDHDAMMAEMQARMDMIMDGEDGEDGKDADEEAIVAKVLQQIKLPEAEIIDIEKLKKEIIASIPQRTGGSIGASVIHKFIDDETPSGNINSSNTVFTLAKAPINGSLKLYLGGARQRVGEDFTLSNKTITFTIAPPTGSILLADYRHF